MQISPKLELCRENQDQIRNQRPRLRKNRLFLGRKAGGGLYTSAGFPINMTSPEPLVLQIQTAPPEEPIPAAPYPNVRSTLNMLINRGVYLTRRFVFTFLIFDFCALTCGFDLFIVEERGAPQPRNCVPFPAMSSNRLRSSYVFRRGTEPTPLRTSESLGLTAAGRPDASETLALVEPVGFSEHRFPTLELVESRRARRLNRAACLVRRFQGSGSTAPQVPLAAPNANAPDVVPSPALTAPAEPPPVPQPPARPAPLTPLPMLVTSQLAGVLTSGEDVSHATLPAQQQFSAQSDEPTRRVAYKRLYTPSQVCFL